MMTDLRPRPQSGPLRKLAPGVVGVLVAVGLSGVGASTANAEEPSCIDNGDLTHTCTQTFQYTGAEQEFHIPEGVTRLDVTVVGADGQDMPGSQTMVAYGGIGGTASVAGWEVPSGTSTLFVEVGGPGANTAAFNGGAANFWAGGGGGASDIRTIARGEPGSLASRAIVAGGGGGAGESTGTLASGAGGDAGHAGDDGFGGESTLSGSGGGAGTAAGGGGGGASPLAAQVINGNHFGPGVAGDLGVGGVGGLGRASAGNGGGGYYGGGGGGAGTVHGSTRNPSGGGGGGSSWAPGGTTGVKPTRGPASVQISWTISPLFSGFLSPVDTAPVVNTLTAGRAVPVKFSLGDDYGLDIFAEPGVPTLLTTPCDATAKNSDPLSAVSSPSGLSYDPLTRVYTYVWKTNKSDAGTCGEFSLNLKDGSTHTFLVELT